MATHKHGSVHCGKQQFFEEKFAPIQLNDLYLDSTDVNKSPQYLHKRGIQNGCQMLSLDEAWQILREKMCRDPTLKNRFRLGRKAASIVVRFDSGYRPSAENLLQQCFVGYSHRPQIELIEETEEDLESGFLPQVEGFGNCFTEKVGWGSKIKSANREQANDFSRTTYYDTLDHARIGGHAGTLALVMSLKNGELLGLTAAHTVLKDWSGKHPRTHRYHYSDQSILSEVKHAGPSHADLPARQVCVIARGFTGGFETHNSSFMDVAKFEVICPRKSVMLNISDGPITICIGKKLVGIWVYKKGAVSDITCGQVVEEDCDWSVKLDGHKQNLPGVFCVLGRDGQVFAEKGDSGSAVFDLGRRVYGMVIGTKMHVIRVGEAAVSVSVCIRMDKMLQYVFQQRPCYPVNEQDERPDGGSGVVADRRIATYERSRHTTETPEVMPPLRPILRLDTPIDRIKAELDALKPQLAGTNQRSMIWNIEVQGGLRDAAKKLQTPSTECLTIDEGTGGVKTRIHKLHDFTKVRLFHEKLQKTYKMIEDVRDDPTRKLIPTEEKLKHQEDLHEKVLFLEQREDKCIKSLPMHEYQHGVTFEANKIIDAADEADDKLLEDVEKLDIKEPEKILHFTENENIRDIHAERRFSIELQEVEKDILEAKLKEATRQADKEIIRFEEAVASFPLAPEIGTDAVVKTPKHELILGIQGKVCEIRGLSSILEGVTELQQRKRGETKPKDK